MPGSAVQPRRQSCGADAVGLAGQYEEHGLSRVIGKLPRAQDPPAGAYDGCGMAFHQPREGHLVAPMAPQAQIVGIGLIGGAYRWGDSGLGAEARRDMKPVPLRG